MGGLEKITEHIINNAKIKADETINEAKRKACEIKKLSDDENKKLTFENDEKIKAECEKIMQMAAVADKPIPIPFFKLVVTAKVGHIPNS